MLDVTVARNAWGRQLDSFEATSDRRGVPLVFIRAPRIRAVGPGVEVLATFGGEPVLVRQGNVVGRDVPPRAHRRCDGGAARVRSERFLPQRGMSSAELWLVRHGETVGGSSTRLYGSTDLALSDVGRRQMECVRAAVADVVFDRVITSPLQRSREAAAIVHPRPEPAATVIAAFTEIDFGDWEGLTADEVAASYPSEHGRWRTADRDWGFPGGETRSGFRARVTAAMDAHLADRGGRSLLVLHKGVVKIIVGTLLGRGARGVRGAPVRARQSPGARARERTAGERWERPR